MPYTVAVVVNKDGGKLGASETFLRAHIRDLPCKVVQLIGNPGRRCRDWERRLFVPSRSIIPLSLRWAARQISITTLAAQDRRAVSWFLKRNRVNAVVAEYGQTAVSVMDACKDASVPLIAHFHGWDAYSEYELKENSDGYRKLFYQAAAIIAVSQHMRNQLISLGANPDKTYHSSCGAEIPDGMKSVPRLAGKDFVMVGRLTEKKAPFISILAFAKVVDLYPDARLDIIGGGPLKDACIQLCSSLGLNKQIVFHGEQSHEVVLDFLARARVFIQHSVRAPSGDHEGTPVGVLEAMGMGLPVVATRHGGIMDAIKPGKSGILVDEYDLEAMAKAMIRYASDAELAQKDGERGRLEAKKNWTNEQSIDRLWGIIQQSIKHNII